MKENKLNERIKKEDIDERIKELLIEKIDNGEDINNCKDIYKTYVESQKSKREALDRKKQDRKQTILKIVELTITGLVGAGSIIGPIISFQIFSNKGFEFERDGSISSYTFRNGINKSMPMPGKR